MYKFCRLPPLLSFLSPSLTQWYAVPTVILSWQAFSRQSPLATSTITIWIPLVTPSSFYEAISKSICHTGNHKEIEKEISDTELLIYSHFENYYFDLKLNDFTLNLLLTIWYLLLTFWNLLFNFEINYSAFKFTVPFHNLQFTFWTKIISFEIYCSVL